MISRIIKLFSAGLVDPFLQGQKPSKKSSFWAKNKRKFQIIALGLTVVVALLGFKRAYNYGGQISSKISRVFKFPRPKTWQVEVLAEEGQQIQAAHRDRIISLTSSSLNMGLSSDLETVAGAIKSMGEFSSIKVLRPQYDVILVFLKYRRAIMKVQTGEVLRSLAEDGTIFSEQTQGTPNHEQEPKDLPLLTGLFDNRPYTFSMRDDKTLITTDEEKTILLQALDLLKLATDEKFYLKQINYKKFRGFNMIEKSTNLDVTLGYSPFDHKFIKLSDILERLKKQRIEAERIELDYYGKAIIKEKKHSAI